MKFILALLAMLDIAASCVPSTPSAPPDAQMPSTYRAAQASSGPSLGDVPWRKLYDDPVLQGLIERALAKNFDVEVAYTQILESESSLGITAANQSVFVNGGAQAPYQETTEKRPPNVPYSQFTPEVGISASYQLDLFGKLASATGSARNALLATESGTDTVLATVVSEVASSYFQLRELDEVWRITDLAITARKENVRLMRLRVEGGESSLQDLRQAEQALYEITENLPVIEQQIAQTENALSVLTGDYPHDIARGLPLTEQVKMPDVPQTGVSSELLQRRPDIRQAQFAIAEAAGNVDVAKKLLYPSITLGGSASAGGYTSAGSYPNLPPALSSLTNVNGWYGPFGIFSVIGQLVQPIFNGGQIRSQIHLSEAQQQQITIQYLQTVHRAFEEVSDDVTAYNDSRRRTEQLKLYDDASIDSERLATQRYENGYTSYLEVLESQTREYQAATSLAQGQLDERLALVQLYLALGGGWQT